jgi:hypothetical protein
MPGNSTVLYLFVVISYLGPAGHATALSALGSVSLLAAMSPPVPGAAPPPRSAPALLGARAERARQGLRHLHWPLKQGPR